MLHRCGLRPKAPGDQRSQWQHDRGRDCLVVGKLDQLGLAAALC
jgi:hypothetical protein